MSSTKSRTLRWLLALAFLGVLAVGGFFWWRNAQQSALALAHLPTRPDLEGVSRELIARVDEAEEAVRRGRNPVEGLKILSRLYQANGFSEPALQIYRGLTLLEPTNPRWIHLEATLLAGSGRLEEAAPLLRRVVELAPEYLPARIRLADALLKLNQTDAATDGYRAVLARDPKNVYALLGLARCKMEAKHWTLAEENLQKAVQADPNFSAAWMLLAGLADQRGDAATAVSDRAHSTKGTRFQDVPDPWVDELFDDCYDPYKLRVAAATLEGAGNPAGATKILERTLQLYPNDAAAHRELARLLMAQGDLARAGPHLEKAVTLAPDDSENWIGLFKLAEANHDVPGATRAVMAGLSHCPNSPSLRLERGRQLLAEKKPQDALVEFNESKRLRPNDPDAMVQIAVAYFYLGDVAKGVAQMRAVLQVQPDHPMALLTLARNSIESGDEANARAYLLRLRQQSHVRPDDLNELAAMYQQRFGHLP